MASRIRRSPDAEADLIRIWLHIAEDNPIAADGVLDFLDEQFDAIAETPKMGRIRDDLWPRGIASGLEKVLGDLIFYYIVDDGIEIARVLEGHRNIAPDWFS